MGDDVDRQEPAPPRPQPWYHEIQAKSALNRVQGMPFGWSLNPYRGCWHGCHYCYARASHAYFDLHPGQDFASQLFVKVNLPEVLAAEVSRRAWQRARVAIGTVTDPYQPAEGRYQLTRRCLEVLGVSAEVQVSRVPMEK